MPNHPSAPAVTEAPPPTLVGSDDRPMHRVLVVDDEAPVRDFLQRVLTGAGFAVDSAVDGPSAIDAIMTRSPDVVLLDVQLPGTNGFEICRRIRLNRATRLTPIILVTGVLDRAMRVEGLDAGADDFLTKPVDTLEMLARVRSLARMKQFTNNLDSAADILLTLACIIEARDGYGVGHCHRMANYAMALGRASHVSDSENEALFRGAFLHDIGMLSIPEAILQKAGPLSAPETQHMRSHTIIGDRLCSHLRSLQSARPIIRWHHEHLDGSGYPDGLIGDQIPLTAQIVGIVDVYEATTTNRPYQTRHSPEEAITILRTHVSRGWRRADLVEAFGRIVQAGSAAAPPTVLQEPVPVTTEGS
jgi:putative two-component system response regulator